MAEPFVEQDTTPGGGPTGWREENPQVFDYLCNLSLAATSKVSCCSSTVNPPKCR